MDQGRGSNRRVGLRNWGGNVVSAYTRLKVFVLWTEQHTTSRAALHAFRAPSDPGGDQPGDYSLAGSSIASYVGIDKRDGLTAIARRLLRGSFLIFLPVQ